MILKYKTKEESIVFLVFNVIMLVTIFVPSIIMRLNVVSILISLIATFISSYFLIIFLLAPNNVHFTFIEEGTAKRIYRGGTFVFALMAFLDHKLDEKFKVIDGEEVPGFFLRYLGVHYIGPWPLYRIPFRDFTWTSPDKDGKDLTRTEPMDYILIRPDIYSSALQRAEDKDNMPIDWSFSGVFEVTDIAAATKVQNPFQIAFSMMWGYLRDETRKQSFDDFIAIVGCSLGDLLDKKTATKAKLNLSKIIMDDWGMPGGLLDDIEEYGMKLSKFNIIHMDPDENYRKLTTKKITAQKQQVVAKIESDTGAYERGQQTVGSAMEMLSRSCGLPIEKLQEIKRNNSEVWEKIYQKEYDSYFKETMSLKKMEIGALLEFNTNATGELGGVAASMAVGSMIANQFISRKNGNSVLVEKVKPENEGRRKNKEFKELGFKVPKVSDDGDDEE